MELIVLVEVDYLSSAQIAPKDFDPLKPKLMIKIEEK